MWNDLHPGRNRELCEMLLHYKKTNDPETGRKLAEIHGPFLGSLVNQYIKPEYESFDDAMADAVMLYEGAGHGDYWAARILRQAIEEQASAQEVKGPL